MSNLRHREQLHESMHVISVSLGCYQILEKEKKNITSKFKNTVNLKKSRASFFTMLITKCGYKIVSIRTYRDERPLFDVHRIVAMLCCCQYYCVIA